MTTTLKIVTQSTTVSSQKRLTLLNSMPGAVRVISIANQLRTDLANDTDPAKGSALAGFLQAGTDAVGRTAQAKMRDIVSVKDFGAVGDGVTDDTAAIQLAINTVGSAGGGTVFFPSGAYKVTSQINITHPMVCLQGTGRRGVYPGIYTPNASGVSTVFADPSHSGPNLFRYFSNTINSLSGFSCQDMAFTMAGSSRSINGFGWDMGHFQYDFVFERVSVHYFNTAFILYKTGSLTDQAAALRIRDSNINHNNFIAKTVGSNSTWNMFEMTGCNAGQNGWADGSGGVDIKATMAVITNNIMEGQRNPIKITGINSPTTIKGNYFEQTTGFANIHVYTSRGAVDIGPNFYSNSTYQVTHRVFLSECNFVHCVDPYWAECCYRASPLPLQNSGSEIHGMGDNGGVYTSTSRLLRVDDVNTVAGSLNIGVNAASRSRVTGRREINPLDNMPMSCRAFVSGGTVGTNVSTFSFTGVTVPAGQWIVVSWMVKHDNQLDPSKAAYINWTSGVADGSQDTPMYYLHQSANVGEFYVFTAAYRCATAISGATVAMNYYPYGTAAIAGMSAAISGATLTIVESADRVRPCLETSALNAVSAAPAAGTWRRGDILNRDGPVGGGVLGFVCVSDGTPGTWREFGEISGSVPVSALRSAATAGAGARSTVSDASANTFGSIVAGGGAITVPVYSDGTDWRVG